MRWQGGLLPRGLTCSSTTVQTQPVLRIVLRRGLHSPGQTEIGLRRIACTARKSGNVEGRCPKMQRDNATHLRSPNRSTSLANRQG